MKQFGQIPGAGRSQQGFTLIELIVVLVILGFIGTIAAAKYHDFRTSAARAAAEKVFAAANSAVTFNFTARLSDPASKEPIDSGERLRAALESGLSEAWSVNAGTTNALSGAFGDKIYNISFSVVEDATPTHKAVLRADWH